MQSILFHFIGVSVSVSIVAVILFLLATFLNERYTVKWRYYLWLLLTIRLLLPLDFGLTSPPVEFSLPDQEFFYQINQEELSVAAPKKPNDLIRNSTGDDGQGDLFPKNPYPYQAEPQAEKKGSGKSITGAEIATGVYLTGAAAFFIWQMGLYFIFRRSTKRWCRSASDARLLETLGRLKVEMGMTEPLEIMICRKLSSPMIVGLFHPVLMLPHEGYQVIDLEVILKHELVHLKRRDLWFKLLLICASGFHWFNPIIHSMVRQANKDIEISCDEEVLKGADLMLRKRYSERILELMQGKSHQEAPVSTSFHGGKGMMKSRIQNIFDNREKKKGVVSFLLMITLVMFFSACSFELSQNEWKIPIKRADIDAYGFDKKGNRNNEMVDTSVGLSYDRNGDSKTDASFTLSIRDKGENCTLEYQGEDGKITQTRVFKGIDVDAGIDYSIQAANLEDQNSVMILISVNYHSMPFGGGYWELYSWKNGEFRKIDLKPVEENLTIRIMTAEEMKNNTLGAGAHAYLYDPAVYPKDYPALALYFKDNRNKAGQPGSITYAPMSQLDVEGFHTWGQDVAGKIVTEMNFVDGKEIQGLEDPPGALLMTEETVYITLPNITANIKRYYQYQDGEWTSVEGYIQ